MIGSGVSVSVNSSFSLGYNNFLAMSGTAVLTANGNLDIGGINPPNLNISGGTLTANGGTFRMGAQSQTITCNIVSTGAVILGSGSASVVVNGSITAGGAVTLGANTTVNGNVAGVTVTLDPARAHVFGNVNASSSVTLGSTIIVTGNVTAPKITLRDSAARIEGNATTSLFEGGWQGCAYSITCTGGGTGCAVSSWKPWPICDDAPPVPSGPGGFNAYDTATPANATTGVIQTKVAGSAFNLDLVALNTAKSAILTSFTGAVKVELLDASGGGALDSNACNASWLVIQTLAANPMFAAADKGRKTVSLQAGDAWRNVAVRVTYPATGAASAIGCSSDHFAIRPATLDVAASDTDWQTAGTGRLLNNATTSGNVVHKAGQPFTITAIARNSSGVVTTKYSGSPAASVQSCLPTGCIAGTVSASGWSGSGTVAATAKYSEAGAFQLMLQDTDFATIDAADTPATCAGRYVCSAAVPVGRFVPDRFDLSAAVLTDRADLSCTPASPFTYMDEPLRADFTLSARNADGAVTRNYHGELAKLDLNLPAALNLGAASVAAGGALTRRSERLASQTSGGNWVNGVANATIGFRFARDS
ncbi:MAG: polymer-forming cytoskeletal protein, partial [Burkholderiaceae bacterium]